MSLASEFIEYYMNEGSGDIPSIKDLAKKFEKKFKVKVEVLSDKAAVARDANYKDSLDYMDFLKAEGFGHLLDSFIGSDYFFGSAADYKQWLKSIK